jgi:Family of unknown function (DUF5706)
MSPSEIDQLVVPAQAGISTCGVGDSRFRGNDEGARSTTIGREYASKLYADVLGWYHSADSKAQAILGFDGALLAFLAATAFGAPDDIRELINASQLVHVLLWAMAASLLLSMVFAFICVWSRGHQASPTAATLAPARLPAEEMWFFQFIARHPRDRFLETLQAVDEAFEMQAVGHQVRTLAVNVRKKHFAVDVALAAAMCALLLLGIAAVAHLSHY